MNKQEEEFVDSLERMVVELNTALELDRTAISSLFKSIFTCNISLSQSRVEVMPIADNLFAYNALSIINACIATNPVFTDKYRIACTCEPNGLVKGFYVHKTIKPDVFPEAPPEKVDEF